MILYDEFKTEDIGIFADGGWDEHAMSKRNYTIIINGNGQDDTNKISFEDYQLCLDENIIHGNSLNTYKARSYYNFAFDKIKNKIKERENEKK